MQQGDLLTDKEAAALLRVSVWTIRGWLSKGRLPRVKAGRLTRLRRSDLEAFLEQPRTASPDVNSTKDLDTAGETASKG